MIYNAIIVDLANIFFRLKGNLSSSVEITRKMVNYTENEIKKYLKKEGILYILFDPISYSDLGEQKSFHYSLNERKKILPDYKANREYSKGYLDSIELYRKYYTYRGEKVQLLYSDEHEADDFVEPLIQLIKKDNFIIALCSTDSDWARYIIEEDNGFKCYLINDSFKKPYTKKQFKDTYKFNPTPTANTFYKACFGDKADNIQGAVFMKKAKFIVNIKVLCLEYIQYISDNNLTINDVLNQFKTAVFYEINGKKDKNCFDNLYLALKSVDIKIPVMNQLFNNIKIIRSSLENKSVEPYIHFNSENKKINEIVHQSLFGVDFRKYFGKV